MGLKNDPRNHIIVNKILSEEKDYIEILDKYAPHISRRMKEFGFNDFTAEDVKQEILIAFWEAMKEGKVKHPSAYLYSLVRNICNTYKNKSSKYQFAELDNTCLENLKDENSLFREFQQQRLEDFEKIRNLMDIHLDNDTKDLIIKKYMGGLSYKELAIEYQKTETSLRKQVSRGLKKIKTLHFK